MNSSYEFDGGLNIDCHMSAAGRGRAPDNGKPSQLFVIDIAGLLFLVRPMVTAR
jgi:hypothetical protein